MGAYDDYPHADGLLVCSRSLKHGLTVLAQFHNQRTVLNGADIARLTGYPRALARRSLMTLAALGYLTRDPGERYRLTGTLSGIRVRRNKRHTPDTWT
jgi:DNA-binding IclR family transcriptional regulator